MMSNLFYALITYVLIAAVLCLVVTVRGLILGKGSLELRIEYLGAILWLFFLLMIPFYHIDTGKFPWSKE